MCKQEAKKQINEKKSRSNLTSKLVIRHVFQQKLKSVNRWLLEMFVETVYATDYTPRRRGWVPVTCRVATR
jgi:hypothetical protein